jgi:DNA-binding NtrC family response regulator
MKPDEPSESHSDLRAYPPSPDRAEGEFEALLERVAASSATVLLEGESGTGKGNVARRIHRLSPRREGPLVEIDLAALSPTLIEAALFGHEEGAFTGAHKARRGYFSRANGGTLVLDGVETLPEELQVKLLRVLQERRVEPLGGEPEKIDVRFVATSGLDLQAEVEAGRFRGDLYFRLAVVPVRVPPLRARLGDLPDLVADLVERIAERNRVEPRPIGAEALARLAAHAWPGNLRELENALERVTVLAPPTGGEIGGEEFSFLETPTVGESVRLAREALASGLTIQEMESAMIEQAVEEQRGNLSAAARQVGLSRRALEYRFNREAGEERE